MKRPSFQFYPGDWLNDAALRTCSVSARGLWIEMLCLMHQGSDYGYLKVNHRPILPVNLARISGATLDETEGYLDELAKAGVYSIDDDGCIYSKRMIRDENIREKRASGGVLGGNPALKSIAPKVICKVDNKVNLLPNLRPTPSSSSSSSSSSSDNTEAKASLSSATPTPPCPHIEIIELYAQHMPNLPQPKAELWDGARAAALRQRWAWLLTAKKKTGERYAANKVEGLDWFSRFFAYVGESDFLTGRGGKWSCDLGWLVKSENFSKVVQGNFENKEAA